MSEENGGVIDGRYSIGPDDVGDFVRVEVSGCEGVRDGMRVVCGKERITV